MNRKALYRASRYASVGISTFIVDLGIVFFLINTFQINYLYAVAVGFIIGISLNYTISRLWVFKGSTRTIHHGYLYFVSAGLISLTAVLTFVGIMVSGLGIPLIIARPIVSGIVGCGNYLFNLHFNFKVAGKHVH